VKGKKYRIIVDSDEGKHCKREYDAEVARIKEVLEESGIEYRVEHAWTQSGKPEVQTGSFGWVTGSDGINRHLRMRGLKKR